MQRCPLPEAGASIKLCQKLRPEVQPLTLLYTIFDRERYGPFRLPPIDKWYPFQKPSLEFCTPFNFCKFTVSSLGAYAAGCSQVRIAVACREGKRSEAQPSCKLKLPDEWNGTFLNGNNWAETNSSWGVLPCKSDGGVRRTF